MSTTASVLQECLVAEEQGSMQPYADLDLQQNPDPDILGFIQLIGITIWRQRDQPSLTTLKTSNLNTQTVVDWLSADETETQAGEMLIAKLLVGEQVQRRDCLKPPKIYTRFEVSRHLMAQSLQISSRAIAKMGTGLSWTASFQSHFGNHIPCHGIGTWDISAAWSYNLKSGINRAFILCGSWSPPPVEPVLLLLDQLKTLSHLPALIPFVVVDIGIKSANDSLMRAECIAERDLLHIQRFLSHEKNPEMLYFGAITRHDRAINTQTKLEAILKMLEQDVTQNLGQRDVMTGEAYTDLVSDHEVFCDAVMMRVQEIKALLAQAQKIVKVSKIQMSSILGFMSIQQQGISQEIARATKQDGASMKILAMMTMLFLPSTAVAAVMAIPVFDWSALSTKDVVSSKIWIFFVVAIPLTTITMLSFGYWLRIDLLAEKVREQEGKETGSSMA